jgi:hypothetical protein
MNHAAYRRPPRFPCGRRRRRFVPGHRPSQIEGPDFLNPRAALDIDWEPATAHGTE